MSSRRATAQRAPLSPAAVTVIYVSSAIAGAMAYYAHVGLSEGLMATQTELAPIGGVHIDSMPDPFRPWAPQWIVMLITVVVAFLIWRCFALRRGSITVWRGIRAMLLITASCFFIPQLCFQIGVFVQTAPMMNDTMLMLRWLLAQFMAAAQLASFVLLYFAEEVVPAAMLTGALLAGVTKFALKRV